MVRYVAQWPKFIPRRIASKQAGQFLVLGSKNQSINQNGPTEQHYDEGAGPLTLTGSRVTSAGSVLAFHYRNRSAVKSTRHAVTNTCPWRPSVQTFVQRYGRSAH